MCSIQGGAIDKSDFIDPSTIPPPPIMAPPPPPPVPLPPSDPDVQCRYIPMKPNATNFGNLDLITMSNVPSGSRILYVHLFVCVFLVFYTLRVRKRCIRIVADSVDRALSILSRIIMQDCHSRNYMQLYLDTQNLHVCHLCVCQLVWRYNMKCVAARLAYLSTVEPGAEANTVRQSTFPPTDARVY